MENLSELIDSTIVSSIIALLGVLLSVVLTYFINKKLNEQQQEHLNNINNENLKVQKEIAKKNIDANITSKARIKWIEEVRNSTGELIQHLTTYQSSADYILYLRNEMKNSSDDVEKKKYKKLMLDKVDEIDVLVMRIQGLANKMTLFYKTNLDDDTMIKLIKEVTLRAIDFKVFLVENRYQEARKVIDILPLLTNEFINITGDQLKTEWEKAKSGK